MTDIIDMDEYRKKIETSVKAGGFDFTEEDREEVNAITTAISEKYISKLNETDHSFSLQADPSQAKIVQDKINSLRTDLNNIIVELIQELAEKSIEAHLLRKYR